MANIVDFYIDGGFVYKCTVRGVIRVAKFEKMKLWLTKRRRGGW